ncbi:MAG: class IV adenylate cyclase [Pyrobaculum sp.]
MLEVEIKFRAVDGVVDRLRGLGFSLAGEREEVDIYFQHPCRDFSLTDEALRVRVIDGGVEITYKGPRSGRGAKTRWEVSTHVGLEVVEILRRLGFVEVARVKKRRKYFERGAVSVSLDWVEGLGQFVEIETVVDRVEEVEGAVETVREVARWLGLAEEVRETYLELILKSRGDAVF